MLKGLVIEGSIVLTGADFTQHSGAMGNCLIIAKGCVDVRDVRIDGCRIIAGKSVTYDKGRTTRSIIVENEPNPLGYIRWSDAPNEKEKAAPKSK
jgi:hypothetical protein